MFIEYLVDWNDFEMPFNRIGNLLRDQQGGFRNTYDVLNDLAKNYNPVWDVEGKIADWKPKAAVYARGGRAEVVLADVGVNYVIKADKDGYVYIDDNKYGFESPKPVKKRGLYDLYIENHMDIPDTISKDSPCYKQFMKEKYSI